MNSIASTSRLMLTAASRPVRQYVPSIRSPPRPKSAQIVCTRLQHTESQTPPEPSLIDSTQLQSSTSTKEKLEYLDHLHRENPVRRKRSNRSADPSVRMQNEWDAILKSIKKSFTFTQLNALRRDMGIPVSLLNLQREICNIRKDSLVRAIMIHRFNMEDPKTTINTRKKKSTANANKEKVTVVHELPLHAAYLAFDIAAQKTSDEFQKLRVNVTAAEPSSEEQTKGVQISITGTQKDVDKAVSWLQAFTADICIEKNAIASIISSQWYDVSDVAELDKIARSSNSIITIGDAPNQELTIYSTNETWLKEAKRMLSKYQHHLREMKDRALLTYASTYSSDDLHSFPPMYALQPFMQRYLSGDNGQPDFFRLARQDNDGRRLSVEERPKVLQNTNDADDMETQVFSKLQEKLKERSDRSLDDLSNLESLTYKAQFGHLLFKSADEQGEMLPEAPFNEQVVLERASSWLSKDVKAAHQTGKAPVIGPRFVAAVPPSASGVEAPFDVFRPGQNDDSGTSPWGLRDGVQEILDSMTGFTEPKLKLNDMIKDLKKFDEYLAIRYAAGDELLEIKILPKEEKNASQQRGSLMDELFGKRDENLVTEEETDDNLLREDQEIDDDESASVDGVSESTLVDNENIPDDPWQKKRKEIHVDEPKKFRFKLQSVKQSLSTQADVLVPEAATDVRLSVESARLIQQKEVEGLEEWQQYLNQISPPNTFMEKEALFDLAKSVSAPTQFNYGGKTYSLLDQVAVNEWWWRVSMGDGKLPDYNARAVMEIEKQCSPCSTTASQKRFSVAWKRPTRRESVAPQSTVWEVAEPVLTAALSEDYKERQIN
ncbi:uncharacterized protein FA14DRAFT_160208 [Meira miltonrushii]|uniref:Uncharacterized protein n=1 Tax=Meira miltonrushii TaxID=1280837 RepID=A0A316VB22_9BASI|nr:uncharacterized protein FA14DRAFT_160208 [Meira miltonrushii]PWN34722.1 hypothetical protein FA14DRAFT_160208 [Meira miltonrushii]